MLDGPLRDRDIRKPDLVTIPMSLLQVLEQDVWVLTLIGSFLDCLLDEVSKDPEASRPRGNLWWPSRTSRSLEGERSGTCFVGPLCWMLI